ncbi:type II toxin-antitoxin system VapC family toxin [uncultured Treponema sp.]|uniref:type II toxin-antitoxin system VapC family toxin n=1 Tax=uncultured Treponema sp. TaxID=162155 RepID=UPI00259AD957|nr:type II toxin-antitoxin system VapC family toxin [uncultured Treponema sp.]
MNKVYLLDTNIVSEFSKECPDQNVISLYEQRKDLCAISAVTWQELQYGLSKMPDGKRKNSIENFISLLKENTEIIAYDDFAADICGKLLGEGSAQGKPLPYCDTQIAATAIANGMVLVTRNVSDFTVVKERSFLKVEDWFSNEE